jgi:hypothetical protein
MCDPAVDPVIAGECIGELEGGLCEKVLTVMRIPSLWIR